MTYNVTPLQESETVIDLVKYANTVTGDILANGILLSMFIILVMKMGNDQIESRIGSAGYITFMVACMFYYVGLVVILIPFIFLSLAAFSTVVGWLKNR